MHYKSQGKKQKKGKWLLSLIMSETGTSDLKVAQML